MRKIKSVAVFVIVALLSWDVASLLAGLRRPDKIDFTVKGTVVPLAQPTDLTCWATVATILVSWNEQRSLAISDVMDRAGPAYRNKFDNNQGLLGSEKPGFLNGLKLRAEAPQNYSVKGWLDLLQKYGPLWVTTAENPAQPYSSHARIVKGIVGDGSPDATFLKIIDPDGGTEYSESVTIFSKKFEAVARQDLGDGADLRPQVVHFP